MTKVNGDKKSAIKSKVQVEGKDVAKVFEKEEPLARKRIYVGPGKPGLITNTVYSGDLPVYVQEMVDQCPAIKSLMVKISDYPVAKKKVAVKGTVEYANAKKVLEYFKSEGGEQ